MVKYFKRSKQDGTVFYVDARGNEISEAQRWSKLTLKGTGGRIIKLSEHATADSPERSALEAEEIPGQQLLNGAA
jgi:hypothetical protein